MRTSRAIRLNAASISFSNSSSSTSTESLTLLPSRGSTVDSHEGSASLNGPTSAPVGSPRKLPRQVAAASPTGPLERVAGIEPAS